MLVCSVFSKSLIKPFQFFLIGKTSVTLNEICFGMFCFDAPVNEASPLFSCESSYPVCVYSFFFLQLSLLDLRRAWSRAQRLWLRIELALIFRVGKEPGRRGH